MISMKFDMKGDIDAAKSIGAWPLQIRKALEYAQRKTLRSMKSLSVDLLTDYYYIKASTVRKAITIGNYGKGGRFIARGTRLPISNYLLTPSRRSKKPKQLYGAVRRNSGMKSLGPAFLMPSRTGKHIAMVRKGSSRLPIEPVIAPAVPQLIGNNPHILNEITASAQQVMTREFMVKVKEYIGAGKYKSTDLSRWSSSYNSMGGYK